MNVRMKVDRNSASHTCLSPGSKFCPIVDWYINYSVGNWHIRAIVFFSVAGNYCRNSHLKELRSALRDAQVLSKKDTKYTWNISLIMEILSSMFHISFNTRLTCQSFIKLLFNKTKDAVTDWSSFCFTDAHFSLRVKLSPFFN